MICNNDFLAQHIVATLLGHCFEWLQHCSSNATLCCAKNRSYESSRTGIFLPGGAVNHLPKNISQVAQIFHERVEKK